MDFKSVIVTPTWNNEDYTIRCFDSIRKNTKDYKIIWVDNGSNPESRKKVADFLDKNNITHEKILNEENLGFVKGTNQGMKRALELGAKYIVLQNNDTEVYKGWLDRLTEVAENDPKIGLVGPITSPCTSWQSIQTLEIKTDYIKDSVDFSNLPKYKNNPEEYAKQIKKLYSGKFVNVSPAVAFFCTLIRSDVARQIGFLSEEYGIGLLDDDDYCTRARNAGWKISLALDVFVFHNHRTTFKSKFTNEKIEKMRKDNLMKFYEKNRDSKDYDFEGLIGGGRIKSIQTGSMKIKFRRYKDLSIRAYKVLSEKGISVFLKRIIHFVRTK